MSGKPPPVLGNGRVLEYAELGPSVTYSGHASVFAGDPGGELKKLGLVPCLAITRDLTSGEIQLLHCDQDWEALAEGTKHESIAQAKAQAERLYRGVSSCWVEAELTLEDASRFRDETWGDERCSFCGRTPLEGIHRMIRRNDARICDLCVAEFQKLLGEEEPTP